MSADAATSPEQHPSRTSASLSIVITTKDRPQLADRALASALAVDVPGLDVVVVDDGSAEPYQPVDDPRVRIIRHDQSQGANRSRNHGLEQATGHVVFFLDDDDEVVPAGVRAELAAFERRGEDDVAVLGTLVSVDETTGVREDHVPYPIPRGADWLAVPRFRGRHAHNGLLVRTDLLRQVGGFDEQIKSWTHDELFLRLLLAAEIVTVPDTVYVMYENPGRSTLRQQQLARVDGIRRTLARHDELHGANDAVTANLMSAAGMHYARARHWRDAGHAFLQAVRADPTRKLVWVRLAKALRGETAS
jgi:glycosyltransferase involved in cell wall biosynthesis